MKISFIVSLIFHFNPSTGERKFHFKLDLKLEKSIIFLIKIFVRICLIYIVSPERLGDQITIVLVNNVEIIIWSRAGLSLQLGVSLVSRARWHYTVYSDSC